MRSAARSLAAALVAEGAVHEAVALLEAELDEPAPARRRARGAARCASRSGARWRPPASVRGRRGAHEAEAELARLGAEHWRAQAARELRRLGRRAPARPRAGAARTASRA